MHGWLARAGSPRHLSCGELLQPSLGVEARVPQAALALYFDEMLTCGSCKRIYIRSIYVFAPFKGGQTRL